MEFELLSVKSLRTIEDEKDVYVEGYASTQAEDLYGHVISVEALNKVAEEIKKPPYNKVFIGHAPLLKPGTDLEDEVPIGKVVDAKVEGDKLWVKAVLNKAHPAFNVVYQSLKDGFLDSFSIGYQATEDEFKDGKRFIKDLIVLEVSIVGIPANPEALIQDVYENKLVETKGVVPSHPWKYGKDDSAWNKPSLSDFTTKSWDELSSEEKRSIAGHFAWSPKTPPERFTDLKLPHHNPKSHAVNLRGVIAAMAALMGARGGVDIPAEDKQKVYRHLAAHYREFGREPPEFKSLAEIAAEFDRIQDIHLKSLFSRQENMEVEEKIKQPEAELKELREENEKLKAELKKYEEREKTEIIADIKKANAILKLDIEENLEAKSVVELKLMLADMAKKLVDVKDIQFKKLPIGSDETVDTIETRFGKLDIKKYNEFRRLAGLKEVEVK